MVQVSIPTAQGGLLRQEAEYGHNTPMYRTVYVSVGYKLADS